MFSMRMFHLGAIAIMLALPIVANAQQTTEVQVHAFDPATGRVLDAAPPQLAEAPDFTVQPLYPARHNDAQAQKEIWWYCTSPQGGRLLDCHITLNWEARANDAGHVHSLAAYPRPNGSFSATEGPVSQVDGYFRTTYYASEVAGLIDVTSSCIVPFSRCADGHTKIGVGLTNLVALAAADGIELTGATQYHPSNHYGEPTFVASIQNVASAYHLAEPQYMLRVNDMSLENGGVFDVEANGETGYDWTPPHAEHRLGQNADVSIPPTAAARRDLQQALRDNGRVVGVAHHDHWHLR